MEQIGVQVRQFDRVLDLFDLVVETADVGVGDVGDLFEDELLDLGARDPLDEQAGTRASTSTCSPARSLTPISGSASSAMRSSSARPRTRARVPSSSSSLKTTTSPCASAPRASTTFSDSLSTTSWPRVIDSDSSSGWMETRILRPAVKTSTVPSSLVPRKVPYPDGGIVSFSTSSRNAAMCSRASRRVADRRSFCETAWASWPLVSRIRSSRVRTRLGASCRRRRRRTISSSRVFTWSWSSPTWCSYSARRRSCSAATMPPPSTGRRAAALVAHPTHRPRARSAFSSRSRGKLPYRRGTPVRSHR